MNFPTGQVRGWGLRCYVKVKLAQSCPTLCKPTDYTVHGILQTRILEWVVFPFSRGSSQPRDRTQVSHIAGDYLLSEPPRKPKNTGGGSLSLLQWIFLTQELNRGLLHCRQILYQLKLPRKPASNPYWLPAALRYKSSSSQASSFS